MSRSFCPVAPTPLPFQNPSTHTRTGGFDALSPPEVRARACFVFLASRLWVNPSAGASEENHPIANSQ